MNRKCWFSAIGLAVILAIGAQAEATTTTQELTKQQAVARVQTILKNNSGGCRITRTRSITAVRVPAGWRVTANVVMAASGRPLNESPTWTVSRRNGAAPQSQLAAEVQRNCLA